MSNKVAIIAANGGLFDAYKVFNIATAAAASEKEVAIFFTFEGLNLIHKEAMHHLEMPVGKEHFAQGFEKAQVPSIPQLVEMAQELGVKFIACQMTELGLTGIPWPEEYGGIGSDYLAYCIAVEELSRVCASTGVTLSAHTSLAGWPIFKYGNEEQKQKYLRPMAEGKKIGGYGLTEAGSGSFCSASE